VRNFYTLILFILPFVLFSENVQELEKKLASSSDKDKFPILIILSKVCAKTQPDKSISYGEQALKMLRKVKYTPDDEASIYNSLGGAYFYKKDFSKSLKYYEKEIILIEKSGSSAVFRSYFNIATLSMETKNTSKAISYFKKTIEAGRKFNEKEAINACYYNLSAIYESEKDYGESLKYLRMYMVGLTSDAKQKLTVLETDYEKVKKEKAEKENLANQLIQDTIKKSEKIDNLTEESKNKDTIISTKEFEIMKQRSIVLEREQKVREQLRIIFFGGAASIIIFVFSIFLFRMYRQKRKALNELKIKNAEIMQQKEEIESQRDEIQDKNKKITESINYAHRIQNALLPGESTMKEFLKDYFILNKPKDIVSGDFYFVTKIKNKIYIGVADCTGHGVPGALMSMLGMTFMNHVLSRHEVNTSNEVLDKIRMEVIESLKQKDITTDQLDGMDLAFVIIDFEEMKAQFSGANNPLYLLRNNEIIQYKPDKMPLAIYRKMHPFAFQEFEIIKGDLIYMFSDGYADQIGGPNNEKFKYNNLRSLLLEVAPLEMVEQKKELERRITDWIGRSEQIDDILLFGMKI